MKLEGALLTKLAGLDVMQFVITCSATMLFLWVVLEEVLNCTWKALTWL